MKIVLLLIVFITVFAYFAFPFLYDWSADHPALIYSRFLDISRMDSSDFVSRIIVEPVVGFCKSTPEYLWDLVNDVRDVLIQDTFIGDIKEFFDRLSHYFGFDDPSYSPGDNDHGGGEGSAGGR